MVLELTRDEIENYREFYPTFIREVTIYFKGDVNSLSSEKPSLREAYHYLHHWKRLQTYSAKGLEKERRERRIVTWEQLHRPITSIHSAVA